MKFKVIVATYNPPLDRFEHCIGMLASQSYRDFQACIVDDHSDSDLHLLLGRVADPASVFIRNGKRMGAMYNQAMAIREICEDPDDVIVFCDGDDALAHDGVLARLNEIYESDPELDLTYGSYQPIPASATCPAVRPYPQDVIQNRSYRQFSRDNGIYWNHLRTFKFKLFQQMDDDDFKDANGNWLMCAPDMAMMTAALELSQKHRYIPEILYHYTSDNPISEWRVRLEEIGTNCDYIFSRPVKQRSEP